MPTNPFEPLEVQAAYNTIAGFFDAFSLAEARRELRQVLTTAGSYRYWKGDPSNVLFFYEKLEGLVRAVLTIHRTGYRRAEAIIHQPGGTPVITDYPQYCGWHHKREPWYFFPRSLSRKQYGNPYKVFAAVAAVAGRRGWQHLLTELQFATLSRSSFNENEDVQPNTMELYLLFSKLVDAAHLVEVRAIHEAEGMKCSKWKGLPGDPSPEAQTPQSTTEV